MAQLNEFLAEALKNEAPALAERWERQRLLHAPHVDVDGSAAEDVAALVCALADSLNPESGWQREVTACGWAFGASAHRGHESLAVMLRRVHLLEAMVLHSIERAAEAFPTGVSAAQMIGVVRGLHGALSLMSESAAGAFVHAATDAQRDRYRIVRHQLRNPLGTIKSAITLMDDESVPVQLRESQKIREMAVRNTRMLDTMIGDLLGEAVSLAPVRREVSMHDLLMSVRRDLRVELASKGCVINVDPGLPQVEADADAMALALEGALAELIRFVPPGAEISVRVAAISAEDLTLALEQDGGDLAELPPRRMELLRALVERMGGSLAPVPGGLMLRMSAVVREVSEDVASASESAHGQP